MKHLILLGVFLILGWNAPAQTTVFPLTGKIMSKSDGLPLPGASVLQKGTGNGQISDEEGNFTLSLPEGEQLLVISFVGYRSLELPVTVPVESPLEILLEEENLILSEVEIVSTGYQEIPKERTTGSFAFIDEELVNRRVSPGILERLADVTPGLIFNRDRGDGNDVSIRGTSTIFSDTQPLIVVDNFPYDGPIENINPNDVESITVLKDAAAASIWGARAGNGVIVITTKNGRLGRAPVVNFTSNFTWTEETDPYYVPQMTSEEIVSVERDLFSRGIYTARENSNSKTLLSPVVETLIALRDGEISSSEAERRMGFYSAYDNREELKRYYYRPALSQQYALGITGGKDHHSYAASIGYDRNALGVAGNDNSRITLNLKNTWSLLGERLTLNAGVYLVEGRARQRTQLPQGMDKQYIPLGDENGNALPIARGYRDTFTTEAMEQGLLDWKYYPLAELGEQINERDSRDLRVNLGSSYRLTPGWTLDGLYQFWANSSTAWELNKESSFFTRDLINTFTQVGEDGSLSYAVPMGSIVDAAFSESVSHHFRLQSNFQRKWADRHQVVALGGMEVKKSDTESNSSRYYGYDEELAISTPVDLVTRYRRFHNRAFATIPYGTGHSVLADRFTSFFANASYTLDEKYSLTGSARKDASNLFGVEANMKGVPLWSVGAGWTLSGENFYHWEAMPFVRLRATFGYNGNINRSVSAYTTAYYLAGAYNRLTGLPSLMIQNPPNPELRWERIKNSNVGLDFETKNGRFAGSMEYYLKRGLDLIGDQPFPSSTGITQFRGNFADTRTRGMEIQLKTLILDKSLKWNTLFIFNTLHEEVTAYEVESIPSSYTAYGIGASIAPRKGYPLYSIYSYQWAGLDPDTGDPMGMVDGEPSTDYTAIVNRTPLEDLVYNGPARPTVFGSLMNNFSWKGWNLSMNITYRLGYYVRRQPLVYNDLYLGGTTHGDFSNRWQEPGDELRTTVPSMPASQVSNRDSFYNRSEINVVKGDHVRIQDIRLGYEFTGKLWGADIKRLEVYGYANNIGVIWRASDSYKDPDYRLSPALTAVSLGLKTSF
ncbi:SusC/RagA family TonB-linked outer membrane protein [Algoriphagus sp.]|uniref:SusC/RagA family TonB-linked outer membrane protein n=1 Tax=Algoriphagus sp. TaxID=1872435 RepID=UPI003F71662B